MGVSCLFCWESKMGWNRTEFQPDLDPGTSFSSRGILTNPNMASSFASWFLCHPYDLNAKPSGKAPANNWTGFFKAASQVDAVTNLFGIRTLNVASAFSSEPFSHPSSFLGSDGHSGIPPTLRGMTPNFFHTPLRSFTHLNSHDSFSEAVAGSVISWQITAKRYLIWWVRASCFHPKNWSNVPMTAALSLGISPRSSASTNSFWVVIFGHHWEHGLIRVWEEFSFLGLPFQGATVFVPELFGGGSAVSMAYLLTSFCNSLNQTGASASVNLSLQNQCF